MAEQTIKTNFKEYQNTNIIEIDKMPFAAKNETLRQVKKDESVKRGTAKKGTIRQNIGTVICLVTSSAIWLADIVIHESSGHIYDNGFIDTATIFWLAAITTLALLPSMCSINFFTWCGKQRERIKNGEPIEPFSQAEYKKSKLSSALPVVILILSITVSLIYAMKTV